MCTGGGGRTTTVISLVVLLSGSVLADMLTCRGKACTYPVWQNPCGLRNRILARKKYLDNEISPDGLRHPSARPLRRVRTQLRITYNHFHSAQLEKDIRFVYAKVKTSGLMTKMFEYDWLPQQQLSWYRDSVKCLDKKSKVKTLLPSLHMALQNFSATFEELQRYGGESHHSEHQEIFWKRRNLLSEISHQIKNLLCEVETAILNVGLELPRFLSMEAGSKMIWDSHPDHTNGLIQDWGVLAAYQSFLDDWLKIMRRLVGSKSNLPCKPKKEKKKHPRKKVKPER